MENVLLKGFENDVFDSQAVFRKILTAMANPGTIVKLDINLKCPCRLYCATGAILLTLLDFETLLWSDFKNLSEEITWTKFHTGAPFARSAKSALFALVSNPDNLNDISIFNKGTLKSPHDSTTLIIQVDSLNNEKKFCLSGPGIKSHAYLGMENIDKIIKNKAIDFNDNYPMGLDMIFVCRNRFAVIPRTTKVEVL